MFSLSNIVRSVRDGIVRLFLCLFTAEVITSVHQLSNLNVTNTEDKVKAKKQAKHIDMRKRKALADLFKYLKTLGKSRLRHKWNVFIF